MEYDIIHFMTCNTIISFSNSFLNAAEFRIQKGFPRSAWLLVCQYNSMNNQTKKFFIYTRKSTDDKDRQVRSISDQLAELKSLALKEQLEVVDVFVEKQTAKIPGRPVFNEMML